MSPTALVLHDDINRATASPDDVDSLDAAESIAEALTAKGYQTRTLPFSGDLTAMRDQLSAMRPDFVFNSVERVDRDPLLLPVVPMLLDHLGLPYSGCDASALAATINKVQTKLRLRAAGIRTADWSTQGEPLPFASDWRGIIKPESEHASFGMLDSSVVTGPKQAEQVLSERARRLGGAWYAETFLDGREFHVGLVERDGRAQVLHPVEIVFRNYPPGKPRIMSFAAKWHSDSFENQNTDTVLLPEREAALADQLRDIAARCWSLFGLSGYARVDLRTDPRGEPHVLEVNANPCFWSSSTYGVAAVASGLKYEDILARLIAAGNRRVERTLRSRALALAS